MARQITRILVRNPPSILKRTNAEARALGRRIFIPVSQLNHLLALSAQELLRYFAGSLGCFV